MAFDVPTLREIIDQIATYFEDEIDGSLPRLRGQLEYVLTRATADQFKDLYGFLEYISRQIFPDSADEIYFWRWAAIWGVLRKAAQPYQGYYQFTGTDETLVPAGTQVQREDGQTYVTANDRTIGGVNADNSLPNLGTVVALITAETAGADANCAAGQILSLTSPISGVDGDGAIDDDSGESTVQAGADAESREDGLERLLLRIRQPPAGGGPGDYEQWALEVAGVTRAWEFANLVQPNSVSVAFVRDNDSGSIVPDASERVEVLSYLQGVAPITVTLYIVTLVEQSIDITLSALNPNTSTVRTAIATSVSDLLEREGGPGKTIPLSRIEEAISSAAGEVSHTLSDPSADIVSNNNQVPVIGSVSVGGL